MKDPYTLHTLANGLQIVIERMPDVRSAAAGFLVCTGARDEVAEQAGVSHFLEHMMFKGTNRRSWQEITIDFDRMGSSYNAFTSEDRTVYYGWVRRADIGKQIELLADMMQSTLPPEEFETERKVILEEIAMAKDDLEHLTFDFLQEKVFAGHPLAWPILGYEQTVQGLSRDVMWDYFRRRYVPDRMILIIAGNVEPTKMIDLAEELCGSWPSCGVASNAPDDPIGNGPIADSAFQTADHRADLSFHERPRRTDRDG
ncbi:MAG: insulinase family protein [Planctomycetes bacterium]|nr:insulinase family protein [Planctomycetota bacterium]